MASKAKELKRKYGVTQAPIEADRILVKPMDHDFGVPANAVLLINTKAGTYTSANVYGDKADQHLGKGYNPEGMTHPLPGKDSEKWKTWGKKGYTEGNLADFPVFKAIKTAKPETADKS
jgi:hypothetical protein